MKFEFHKEAKMKKLNHDRYLKELSRKMAAHMGKETSESRKARLEAQGGARATCGSVFSDKRRKKLDRAMVLE